MNEDERNQVMKRHMIMEYKNWLHELKMNRMQRENLLEKSESFKRNLRDIQSTAFKLFGAEFAHELDELDELGELPNPMDSMY